MRYRGQAVGHTIGLVQGQNVYSGQCYLPYAVGLLHAAALQSLQFPEQYQFLMPVWKREPPAVAARRLLDADLVFFSVYVWNERWSLAVAEEYKRLRPDGWVVMGGPQVPDHAEAFLKAHPQVDLTCQGEGEAVAVAILEALRLEPATRWQAVPSIRYRGTDGTYRANPVRPRQKALAEFPSPYLAGCFDALLRAYPDERWLMLLETNRGCPYACTFCDWGSATATRLSLFPLERIDAELSWAGEQGIDYIFVCDANFGILPRDHDIVGCAQKARARHGNPQTLSVQTAKIGADRIFSIWRAIIAGGLNREAALPVQSTDAATLQEIKRINLSLPAFQQLSHRFAAHGIRTYSDVILGLPGESYTDFANSVDALITHGQHHRIQFSNLTVLPNAELAGPSMRERYGLKTVQTRIATCWSMQGPADPLPELQELVVGTTAMPPEDWIRTRVLAWGTVLFHCHKLLQLPHVLLHRLSGVSFRRLLEALCNQDSPAFPVLSEIRRRLLAAARGIQAGIPEYISDPRLPGIWLPPDDLSLTLLHVTGTLPGLFSEAYEVLHSLLVDSGAASESASGAASEVAACRESTAFRLPAGVLEDSIALSQCLITGVGEPLRGTEKGLVLRFNLWEVFLGQIEGRDAPLRPGRFAHALTESSDFYRRVKMEEL